MERQDVQSFKSEHEALQELISGFAKLQNERIHNRSSKTRLSILYFAITGNMLRISRQSLRLYEIFEGSLVFDEVKHQKFDKPATEA